MKRKRREHFPNEEKTTLFKRIVEKCENHPIICVILLIVVIVGGISNFIENVSNLATRTIHAFSEKDFEMRVVVLVQNTKTNVVDINPLCSVSIEERFPNQATSTSDEEHFRLKSLLGSASNPFSIPAKGTKEFELTLPDTERYRTVFKRGSGLVLCTFWFADSREPLQGQIPFDQKALKQDKLTIKL